MGFILSKHLDDFIEENTTSQDEVLYELDRATNLQFRLPQMISGTVQGKFLEMIVHMQQPKNILEIGTFTGYSGICFAKALPKDGKLITIDYNEELEEIANEFFEKAGVADKIDLIIGNAKEILPTISETFDLVFIDADKTNYSNYFDLVLPKVRIGGFILADNVLWGGKVVEEKKDKETKALIEFSRKVDNDQRVENVILSIRDGITLIRKISD